MKLKRIIAALISASVLSANAFAFLPYVPEDTKPQETEQQESVSEDTDHKKTVLPYNTKDIRYQMFEQILDAYVEKHLYDFTEEEVLHKFFADFLSENPMYFSIFMDYILGTMDPYSAYHSASSNFLEPDKGATGFGFNVKDSDKGVYIDSVIPGSSAEDAGFAAGDRFVSIAGINIENHTFDVVSTVLAKPTEYMENAPEEANTETEEKAKHPTVEIVVDRNGELLTFNLSKGPMVISQISHVLYENDGKPTAYIVVSSFLGEDTDTDFINIVKKYADDGVKHLTIDLRDNGGGSLDYALAMVETFLENGETICYYDEKALEEPTPVISSTDKVSFDSITILINENTASAAELFTSILKDKGLAKVIGTKSYGKSLGQEIFSLANGDYITITTYRMLNEKFESYDGIGISPDLTIEDVEMCYTLPALGVFNHQNYVEIKEGEYSDVTKAFEDRLYLMGVLREQYCDGIFDDVTKTALFVLQKDHKMTATGYVDYDTVSLITKIINSYKAHTYYDDAPLEVAMIVHHSFSQGKRLVAEKERLREKQAAAIEERDAALNAAYDAEHAQNNQ